MSMKERIGKKIFQQFPVRIHVDDHKKFKSKLALEPKRVSMQSFVEACVIAYLEGDDHIKAIVRDHVISNKVDKKTQTWTKRERDRLLDEIERVAEDD